MKKYFMMVAAMTALVFSSCSNTEYDLENSSEMEEVTLKIKTDKKAGTRADAEVVPDCNLRYLLALYTNDTKTLIGDVQEIIVGNSSGYADAEFDFSIPKGADPLVVVWIDYVNSTANPAATQRTKSATDLYYKTNNTGGLKEITMIGTSTTEGSPMASTEMEDAFTASQLWSVAKAAGSIIGKRPLAQLNVYSSDKGNWGNFFTYETTDDLKINITLADLPTTFNAVDGDVTAATSTTYQNQVTVNGNFASSNLFFSGLVFAPADNTTYNGLKIKAALATKNVAGITETYTINNVPFQRNYKTNITGSLVLESVEDFTITTAEGYETPDKTATF